MSNEAVYNTLIVDTTGIVLFNTASLRQMRDIAGFHLFTKDIVLQEEAISAAAALELLRASYPKNPRLPVGRPAVLRGNETTRLWHKFCVAANREFTKTLIEGRCNTDVTTT